MADDVDQLLRAAMKHVDGETPSGYFEGLPERTLARLEGELSMQTEPSTDTVDPAAPPPPSEDSGLHDIRNLARSARASASSRRITASPPIEDDVLASSSAGWKAVALPEPAKMVSLPELSELPSASEVRARDKAARKAEKAEKAAVTAAPAVSVTAAPASAAPATAAPVVPIRTAKKPAARGNVARNAALAAMGVAAAAGIVVVALNTTSSGSDATTTRNADHGLATGRAEQAPAAAPAAAPAVKVESVPAVTTNAAAAPASTDADTVAAPVGNANTAVDKVEPPKGKAVGPKKQLEHKVTIEDTGKKPEPKNAKLPAQQAPDKNDKGEKSKDQSLDDLLKDSNNGGAPSKPSAPKLDKK